MLEKLWDKLAIKYSEFYIKDANQDLLEFCIKNENEDFLKYAFNNYVFLQNVIDSEETIDMILQMLESKLRLDYIINILLYVDFDAWPREKLGRLVELFSEIATED